MKYVFKTFSDFFPISMPEILTVNSNAAWKEQEKVPKQGSWSSNSRSDEGRGHTSHVHSSKSSHAHSSHAQDATAKAAAAAAAAEYSKRASRSLKFDEDYNEDFQPWNPVTKAAVHTL